MTSPSVPQGRGVLFHAQFAFHIFASLVTALRLAIRLRARRFWWEDAAAALALAASVVSGVALWLNFSPLDCTDACPAKNPRVIGTWVALSIHPLALWSTRLSILLSILRVVPPGWLCNVARASLVLFVAMWATTLILKVATCASHADWETRAPGLCPLDTGIAIVELITDISGDVILVFLPLRLLWRTRLQVQLRVLTRTVFAMSILSSAVSVAHTVFLIPTASFASALTVELQLCVSLIVCNLLVIVTFVYRYFLGSDIEETLSSTQLSVLTTIDLESSISWPETPPPEDICTQSYDNRLEMK